MTRDQADEQRPEGPERCCGHADPPPPARVAAEERDGDDGECDTDELEREAEVPGDVLAEAEAERAVREHRQRPEERPAEDCCAARLHPMHIDADDEPECTERGGHEPSAPLRLSPP